MADQVDKRKYYGYYGEGYDQNGTVMNISGIAKAEKESDIEFYVIRLGKQSDITVQAVWTWEQGDDMSACYEPPNLFIPLPADKKPVIDIPKDKSIIPVVGKKKEEKGKVVDLKPLPRTGFAAAEFFLDMERQPKRGVIEYELFLTSTDKAKKEIHDEWE